MEGRKRRRPEEVGEPSSIRTTRSGLRITQPDSSCIDQTCYITQAVITRSNVGNFIKASDGNCYDRKALKKWILYEFIKLYGFNIKSISDYIRKDYTMVLPSRTPISEEDKKKFNVDTIENLHKDTQWKSLIKNEIKKYTKHIQEEQEELRRMFADENVVMDDDDRIEIENAEEFMRICINLMRECNFFGWNDQDKVLFDRLQNDVYYSWEKFKELLESQETNFILDRKAYDTLDDERKTEYNDMATIYLEKINNDRILTEGECFDRALEREAARRRPIPSGFMRRTPKRRTPKRRTPKRRTPKRRTPKKRTPKRRTPKKRTPKKRTPKKRTPKRRTSRRRT